MMLADVMGDGSNDALKVTTGATSTADLIDILAAELGWLALLLRRQQLENLQIIITKFNIIFGCLEDT